MRRGGKLERPTQGVGVVAGSASGGVVDWGRRFLKPGSESVESRENGGPVALALDALEDGTDVSGHAGWQFEVGGDSAHVRVLPIFARAIARVARPDVVARPQGPAVTRSGQISCGSRRPSGSAR